jgi:hypothetical protein
VTASRCISLLNYDTKIQNNLHITKYFRSFFKEKVNLFFLFFLQPSDGFSPLCLATDIRKNARYSCKVSGLFVSLQQTKSHSRGQAPIPTCSARRTNIKQNEYNNNVEPSKTADAYGTLGIFYHF